MKREVIWSDTAMKSFLQIGEYVSNNFGQLAAVRLKEELDERLKNIVVFPTMYPRSENYPTLRECVLSKQTKFYYTFEEKSKASIFLEHKKGSGKFARCHEQIFVMTVWE